MENHLVFGDHCWSDRVCRIDSMLHLNFRSTGFSDLKIQHWKVRSIDLLYLPRRQSSYWPTGLRYWGAFSITSGVRRTMIENFEKNFHSFISTSCNRIAQSLNQSDIRIQCYFDWCITTNRQNSSRYHRERHFFCYI